VSFSSPNNFILDDTELVIVDGNEYPIDIPHGETNHPFKCKPTHPDVNVSLIHGHQYTARGENWLEPKVRKIQNLFGKLMKINLYWVPIYYQSDLLADPNSNWSFEKRNGLKLKKAKIDDNGIFNCIGTYKNKKHTSGLFLFIAGRRVTRFQQNDTKLLI
jgi:hypothetical protein